MMRWDAYGYPTWPGERDYHSGSEVSNGVNRRYGGSWTGPIDCKPKEDVVTLPESKLISSQEKKWQKMTSDGHWLTVTIRHDDCCGNGHNTFSITAETYQMAGCLHDLVAEAFPELQPFIKWHLCSTDGPLHYIANTLFWAGRGSLDNARNSAIWPEATLEQLHDRKLLEARLPQLMIEFRAAVESLGLVY